MEFAAFGVTEAQLLDVFSSSSLSFDDACTSDNLVERQQISLDMLEKLMFQPRVKSISESGVSISYDYEGLGKWYLYLCKKLGYTPNDDIVGMLGLSAITDKTNIW